MDARRRNEGLQKGRWKLEGEAIGAAREHLFYRATVIVQVAVCGDAQVELEPLHDPAFRR